MPKPASGQPHWEAIAVKLPPELMAEVRRYTDIHGLSLSDLIRQGLEMRLHGEALSSWYNVHTDRLSHLLHRALALVEAYGPASEPTSADTPGTQTPPRQSTPRKHAVAPEVLAAMAQERARCPELSIRELSQRLYDLEIYRAKGDKPAEAGWLHRQLAKARAPGGA